MTPTVGKHHLLQPQSLMTTGLCRLLVPRWPTTLALCFTASTHAALQQVALGSEEQ